MENLPFRYDIEGLAQDMDIELPAISTLYKEYFIEMKSNIEEGIELLSNNNFTRLERVIHNIKGISVSLNINDVYEAANELDMKLKTGNYDTAVTDIKNIIDLFKAAEKDIREFFKQNSINL